jgi:membrane peptidoglycan carboxypeptidase
MGWYPAMVIPDYHTNFPNVGQGAGALAPQKEDQVNQDGYMYAPPDFSWDGKWNAAGNKNATVRLALQESENVGAIKAMKYAGPENVLNLVHRLGLSQITTDGQGISWALGTQSVSVLQMSSAYQAFANGGKRVPPQGVLDIWDNYGHNLYHYDTTNPPSEQVISPQVAFLITSVLTDEPSRAAEFKPYHTLSFYDLDYSCAVNRECSMPVAAKTGTTDGFHDTWTMGYTPNVVVGSWTGNANNEAMQNILGISGAGTIWHSVIKTADGYCGQGQVIYEAGVPCPENMVQKLGISQETLFPVPDGIVTASVSATDGLAGGGNTDYFIQGQVPLQAGATQPGVANNN